MIWVDNISDLEYFNSSPDWPCYADIVTTPHDILLQAQLGPGTGITTTVTINLLKPDGTFIEDATSYFDVCWVSMTIAGIDYYYANIRLRRYSPGMVLYQCFVLQATFGRVDGQPAFSKYTQKYQLLNTDVNPSGIRVSYDGDELTNIATLCSTETKATCNPLIKILAQFDCIDTFTGDFYGEGIFVYGTAGVTDSFPFVRFSWIEGRVQKMPTAMKRTISVNCRTQRTERTVKYIFSAFKPFPLWKMEEIEGMMLANHLFIGDKEYQSEGGTPFEQFGPPKQCVYMYKLGMELQDCYEWQTFGCTPPCQPMIYYYPIAF